MSEHPMTDPLDAEGYRYRASECLRLAAEATNMAERSRRIDEAAHWQMKAAGLETSPASDSLSTWLALDLDEDGEAPDV